MGIGGAVPASGTAPAPGDKDARYDPRDGSLLVKKYVANPNGPAICIDVNPKTGGVFLDKGELDQLSKIPDVAARLEQTLLGA